MSEREDVEAGAGAYFIAKEWPSLVRTLLTGQEAEAVLNGASRDWQDLLAAVEGLIAQHREDAVAEALAPVRALAEEWEGWSRGRSTPRIDAFRDAAEQLIAVLPPERLAGEADNGAPCPKHRARGVNPECGECDQPYPERLAGEAAAG